MFGLACGDSAVHFTPTQRSSLISSAPSASPNPKSTTEFGLVLQQFFWHVPASFNNLSELNKFNISYNPLIYGVIPITGQLLTFEKSYLGDPHLEFPNFIDNTTDKSPHSNNHDGKTKRPNSSSVFLVLLVLTGTFLTFGLFSLIICIAGPKIWDLLDSEESIRITVVSIRGYKARVKQGIKAPRCNAHKLTVIKRFLGRLLLDKTASTHADILKATGKFSEERIIGKGGFWQCTKEYCLMGEKWQ
ncbi:putative lrr receptor-like serine/threonine-protein kinase [Quercus suber]|uniref:Lrr receptor-like serine/threonine-protein kinase n=1 Tax=Quercus suber TaxID=58331 RepID=A0AAW0KB05_QUESU